MDDNDTDKEGRRVEEIANHWLIGGVLPSNLGEGKRMSVLLIVCIAILGLHAALAMRYERFN